MSTFRIITPIGNAIQAYKARLYADKSAHYEHLWRLIHIQEAIVVCMTTISATRMLHYWSKENPNPALLNKLRSIMTGLSCDDESFGQKFSLAESCFSGSLAAWVNLLSWITKNSSGVNCDYIKAVGDHLNTKPPGLDELAFISEYRHISPNVSSYEGKELNRIRRFEAINSLRNKIAHVPLPYEKVEPIHHALKKEIFSSLLADFRADKNPCESTKWFDIFKGKIETKQASITGSDFAELPSEKSKELVDDHVYYKSPLVDESWDVTPFLQVNQELKVSVLFRVRDFELGEEHCSIEYHRFAAESNSVKEVFVETKNLEAWMVRRPQEETNIQDVPDNKQVVTQVGKKKPVTSGLPNEAKATTDNISASLEYNFYNAGYAKKSEAIRLYNYGFYERAINAFEDLHANHISMANNVTKLKLGQAYLRFAVKSEGDSSKQLQLLEKAAENLKEAFSHPEDHYRASAHYELSKVYYRKSIASPQKGDSYIAHAKDEVKQAIEIFPENRYDTWLEYLNNLRLSV